MKNFKHIFYTFALVAIAFCASAQQPKPTTITGTISDSERPFALLRWRDNLDTLKLNENGNFKIVIELSNPEECKILSGKQTVRTYMIPGGDLHAEFSAAKPVAAVFSGKCAAASGFYESLKQNEGPLMRYTVPKGQAIFGPARITQIEDSLFNLRSAFVTKYAEGNGLNSEFAAYQKAAMHYLCLSELGRYRATSPNMRNDSLKQEFAVLEKSLYSAQLDNVDMLYNEYYQAYVRNLVNSNVALTMELTDPEQMPEYYSRQFDEVLKLVSNQECRNYLLKELVVEAMKETGTRNIKPMVDRFDSICSNEPMKMRVAKVWAPYLKMQAGMPCPPIENYSAEGVTSTIDLFKGKVVYIDIWATWCGPCKREIPTLKALEKEYHGKNIEFVSISVDKDVDAWKKFIVDQELTGTQLHQSDDVEKTVSLNFAANSIPRFILLDEEGRIVSADAPRPSSGDVLKKLIDAELND